MLENKLREDLERLKKIRAHRGLRHYWGQVFVIVSRWSTLLIVSLSLQLEGPWPAHQDHWSPWSYSRCVQEEVNVRIF